MSTVNKNTYLILRIEKTIVMSSLRTSFILEASAKSVRVVPESESHASDRDENCSHLSSSPPSKFRVEIRSTGDFHPPRGALWTAKRLCSIRDVKSGGRRLPQGAGPEHRARSPLTGLETSFLQLDEARRLEQRVEEAHIGSAARRARYERARCHAATGHARRWPLTWPSGRRANGDAARASRGPRARPIAARDSRRRGGLAIDVSAARGTTGAPSGAIACRWRAAEPL
ncbi:unnamed protein product [Euphydryas editha]|uniref:Uncharacterized protein n=1 Tax=Euphydryas editha TaxID=104508 RepID=A0AAU9U4F1_EUPED|nr:unnamed protein product [Euphydryas editha]